jgi:ubiquinone/menaquinone biosynthesis C-methylase UbiE
MERSRVPETDQGIQGQPNVELYDQMQKRLRDKGWMETQDIIKAGITYGLALEIGPGPGYLGLEWLKNTQTTTLKGLDISADMIAIAQRNAADYRLADRVEYIMSAEPSYPLKTNCLTLCLRQVRCTNGVSRNKHSMKYGAY